MSNPSVALTPEAFVKTLEGLSLDTGKRFGRLETLRDAESAHAARLAGFRGYTALAAASQCFVLETVEQMNTYIRPNIITPLSAFYPQFVERLVQYFRTLCAADKLASQGYPLHGYTQLRNLFDSAILAAAAAQGLTNFYKLEGIDPAAKFDATKFRKDRRNEEREVRSRMTGDRCGLSDATQAALKTWDVLFDDETHGGVLSRTQSVGWLKGTASLPVLPTFQNDAAAMFMNRYCEVGWMVHRLLPLLQPKDTPLPAGWKQSWETLDTCFRQSVESLTTQLGKPVGSAIVELVRTKFPFNADSSFWD